MLVQFDPLSAKPIELRCLESTIVPADIAPAQIIGDDHQEIGLRAFGRRETRRADQKQRDKRQNRACHGITLP